MISVDPYEDFDKYSFQENCIKVCLYDFLFNGGEVEYIGNVTAFTDGITNMLESFELKLGNNYYDICIDTDDGIFESIQDMLNDPTSELTLEVFKEFIKNNKINSQSI